MSSRRCDNWLMELSRGVRVTESPEHFWLWSGIFTIAAAVQRKVWLPYGISTIYPNLYVMIVAPPGVCRKSPPVKLAKQLLLDLGIPVYADSPSKRALTKALAKIKETNGFEFWSGDTKIYKAMSSYSLISEELSSFLALDPKGMIEVLTDLFDSSDRWEYKTSDKGEDILFNVCINCLFASTPIWIAANLPAESIGGGFTSRFLMVSGLERARPVAIPEAIPERIYKNLIGDLSRISNLVGPFSWSDDGRDYFVEWYNRLPALTSDIRDWRLQPSIARMHIQVIKTAMALRMAYSDELVLTADDIGQAKDLVDSVVRTATDALDAYGRSPQALNTKQVMTQIRQLEQTTLGELMKMNYHDTTLPELKECLEALTAMGKIRQTYNPQTREQDVFWLRKGDKNA